MERVGQHFDELPEVNTTVSDVVENRLTAVSLIFHIANFHFQSEILGNLARAYLGLLFACLGFGVLLHINIARLAVDSLNLNIGFQTRLLHLQLNQPACHYYRAYIVAG